MTEIKIYDSCAEKIEEIAEKNDSTAAGAEIDAAV